MRKIIEFLAVGVMVALTGTAAQAAQITVADFTSPTIVGFGSPGSFSEPLAPLTIGPASFTDPASSYVQWYGSGTGFNDCVGGCVSNESYGVGTLEVTLSPGFGLAGLYVGQATAYSLDVSFYDAGDNLLGTVTASGASDGVSFAGWESTGAPIAKIDITNSADNSYVVVAQSGYFQASAVPEPATWLLMLGSFALIGTALGRARRTAQAA